MSAQTLQLRLDARADERLRHDLSKMVNFGSLNTQCLYKTAPGTDGNYWALIEKIRVHVEAHSREEYRRRETDQFLHATEQLRAQLDSIT